MKPLLLTVCLIGALTGCYGDQLGPHAQPVNLTCRTADGDLCPPPPPPQPPPPGVVTDTLRFLGCSFGAVFQFYIDSSRTAYGGANVSWFVPVNGTMKIPATTGKHRVDITRWVPTIGGVIDSVSTGVPYQLPCS